MCDVWPSNESFKNNSDHRFRLILSIYGGHGSDVTMCRSHSQTWRSRCGGQDEEHRTVRHIYDIGGHTVNVVLVVYAQPRTLYLCTA